MAPPWKAIGTLATGAVLAVAGQHLVRQREVQVAARGPDGPAGGGEPIADQLQQCVICFDDTIPEAGISCRGDGQHFFCDGCFDRHVEVACAPDNAGAFVQAGCRIFCSQRPCTAAAPVAAAGAPQQQRTLPFLYRDVALHVQEATLQAYLEARRNADLAQGQREGQELAAAQQGQQEQRRGRPEEAAAQQQHLQQARGAIIDAALTLLPPCCRGGVVEDWDACFAVRCAWCRQYFCGFCLEYHGSSADTHAHVTSCRLRMPGVQRQAAGELGYFAAPGEAAWARQQLFAERLDAAFRPYQDDPGFVNQLVAAMEVDIRELGLDPARFKVAEAEREPGGAAAAGAAAADQASKSRSLGLPGIRA
jgi:hypothetical protein